MIKGRLLLVLDRLDDLRAGRGAGGEEAGKDPDQEPGEDRQERRYGGVVEGDLKPVGAGATDEEVAKKGSDDSTDNAADEAYDHPFTDNQTAYL